jgi:hypothetical protein
METVSSFLQGPQRTTGTVFSFRCCTDRKRFSVSGEFGREQRKRFSVSERSFIPLDLDECGGNGFQFPSLYRRNRFLVSCEVGRDGGNGFQFPLLYRPETFFSFRQVWQRTEETVFSFRKIFRKSRRVRDARKSASERVHCCFCLSPRQANSAILINLDQKTSVHTQKIFKHLR